MNGLTLDDVVLSYPDGDRRLTALDRVSLDVDPGGFTAIAGPSGSGKSSLLAVAATLLRPDSGRVLIAGQDTAALSPRRAAELRRDRIGIVFQQPNLLPSLTALEQLQAVAHLRGDSPKAALPRAAQLLTAVGLTDAQQRRRPHQLSGGERQRVNIARALFTRPAVLLVDEPTSALDRTRGAAVVDLLATVTRDHATATVMVTHDLTLAARADQVLHITDGRLR
ncbi:ABC transporter ATP-binding protein [Streptacidiphilus carbonis]|jgi:putative ABC transport system ATP-binding protein|uniref:ABC transporter ATP-binding protein n=1 Tax=Streptacidiphilus carbonis TaxID=105422 RepID=UPI0005A911DF|nr:ABC transporter ATP-binding protein [Streptacidiphilus carbonis]